MSYDGVLPVNKPAGFTSHDVVAKVRRIVGLKRIGHTGTLDPGVTGVLPLCLGKATRFVEYIQELPKEYEAELTFGYSTDTEDWTGETIKRLPPGQVHINEAELRRTISSFVGTIEQVPPMYSAVKIGGKKLYELAREGKEVERKARKVDIYEIELLQLDLAADYPTIRFRVLCSKGTYIRTLCVDIGLALGFPAVMTKLVRSRSGSIGLDMCLTLEQIEELHRSGRLAASVMPGDRVAAHLPLCTVSVQEAVAAMQGKTVPLPKDADTGAGELFRVYDPQERFIGLFRLDRAGGMLRPEKVFAQSLSRPDAD
ncbi:tRNA pseudouridine(55) synthase TruB [Paenibacillus ginsengarvi]|uniref:tRNA pseudouridine synthase B n=1 Tax=Paenibacillus ginsengarvi TaxID=400777 RepID=A0A3B0CLB3_9BACL|nr:tRNA pseudouridine(55) synthase TruB [Paenibacillus ginsengarvi]RKN86475.1 tRNA pseudouridine(55) synthase TruB [Paenibacillus ginsengarvi]